MLSILGLHRRNATILVVGLDNSGKTTILEHLKPRSRDRVDVVPTVGFSVDTFTREGTKFKAFDMSGASKYRRLWEKYYKETDAVVFVVDSSDRLRLAVAREELSSMLGEPFTSEDDNILSRTSLQPCACSGHRDLKNCPVLFLANKQDVANRLAPAEIADALSLHLIENHPWQIMPTNALKGDGLDIGVSWLVDQLK